MTDTVVQKKFRSLPGEKFWSFLHSSNYNETRSELKVCLVYDSVEAPVGQPVGNEKRSV